MTKEPLGDRRFLSHVAHLLRGSWCATSVPAHKAIDSLAARLPCDSDLFAGYRCT